MAIDHGALATEIDTDPLTYGYSSHVDAGDDQAIADLLNEVRDGTDGEAAIKVKRPDCKPGEVMEAIDIRDFPSAPGGVNSIPLAQAYLQSILREPAIRLLAEAGGKTQVRKNLDRLVDNVQGSQTRLDALAERHGSRAEQLFGFGTHVTNSDVATALGRD